MTASDPFQASAPPLSPGEVEALRQRLRGQPDRLHGPACVCENCFRWPDDVQLSAPAAKRQPRRSRRA